MANTGFRPARESHACAPASGKASLDTPNQAPRIRQARRPGWRPAMTALLILAFAVSPNWGQPASAASQPAGCIPNSGWVWTSGPAQPEIASLAQQALGRAGIEAAVEARSFGETDSCGTFAPTATDFTLSLAGGAQVEAAARQQLADQVFPILRRIGKLSLGNVKLKASTGGGLGPNDRLQTLTPSTVASGSPQMPASLGQYAFVTLIGNNTASVLDTKSNTVVQSAIAVGSAPHTAAYSPDGGRLYVTDNVSNTVSVVDTVSRSVIRTIPVGSNPRGIAVSQDGRRVYVSNNGSQSLSIIDAGSLGVSNTVPLTAHPEQSALSPDGRRLFIPATAPFIGFILDTASETLVGSFGEIGGYGIAITPDGAYAYISNSNGTVAVVDLATLIAIKTIPVGSFPHRVTMSPNGQRVYVANVNSNNVSVIDTASNTVVATIPVGGSPWAMDLLDDGSRLYVPTGSGSIALVNTGTNIVTQQIPVGAAASGIAIFHPAPNALRKKVYVIDYDPVLSNSEKLSTYLGWNNYVDLEQGTVDLFKQASHNQVWFDIVDTTVVTDGWPALIGGFQYTESSYLAVLHGSQTPPSPSGVDYTKIVNSPQFDICGKVNRGEIDEVWIFNGPYFGFWESTLAGPGAFWYNSSPVPGPNSCTKLVPIMGPSPERGVAEEVHNFGHRTESTMQQVYGSWSENSIANGWDQFALVQALSPSFNYSGCGDTHFPPNGTSDYDYSNPGTVQSNCEDFTNYPSLHDPATVLQPVTCSLWGCDHLGYLAYMFRHIPASSGCGPGNIANNWWPYIVDPDRAMVAASVCQAAPAGLEVNFSSGQPGSFFTLAGVNLPPNSPASMTINGKVLGQGTSDSSGSLIFILTTWLADPGSYVAAITANSTANLSAAPTAAASLSAQFWLDPAAPLRPQVATGTVITLPAGIAFNQFVSLPVIRR